MPCSGARFRTWQVRRSSLVSGMPWSGVSCAPGGNRQVQRHQRHVLERRQVLNLRAILEVQAQAPSRSTLNRCPSPGQAASIRSR